MFYLKLYCFYNINITVKQIEISNVKKCFSPCKQVMHKRKEKNSIDGRTK